MPSPDLFERYEDAFGEPPPLALLPAGEEAELIQRAIKTGEPLQDRTPPGADAGPLSAPTLAERARAGGLEAALRAQAVAVLRVRRTETFERGGELVRSRLPDPEPLELDRDTLDAVGDLLRPAGQRRLWDQRRSRAIGQGEPPPRTAPPRTAELALNRASRKDLSNEALRVLDEDWPLEPADREAIADLLRPTRDRVLWRQGRTANNAATGKAAYDAEAEMYGLVELKGLTAKTAAERVAPRYGLTADYLRRQHRKSQSAGASWFEDAVSREAERDLKVHGPVPVELVAQHAVDLMDNQAWSRWEAVKAATRNSGHEPARVHAMGEKRLRELAAREITDHDRSWS